MYAFCLRSASITALALALSVATVAQTTPNSEKPAEEASPKLETERPAGSGGWKSAGTDQSATNTAAEEAATQAENVFEVPVGTHIPLSLINSVSTRSASPGDRVYLETTFPIFSNGKIVIPPGSYVLGTITSSKRPGRVKGKGEMHLRFDSITLPNGVTRDFRARVGGLDGGLREGLDRNEGTVKGDSSKGSDAMTTVGTTVAGGQVGALGGLAAGSAGRGAGIGLAAGAAAGLATVLLTRGPDVVLPSGTNLELVTDRVLQFTADEIKFEGQMQRSVVRPAPAPEVNQPSSRRRGIGGIGGIGDPF